MASEYGGRPGVVFDDALHAFTFRGTADHAAALAADPRVASVERDRVAHAVDDAPTQATQLGVDDAHRARDGTASGGPYTGDGVAQRARIAILDTGIDWSHPYFQEDGGNVLGHGYGRCVGARNARDLNGHGTRTASNAAGLAGTAKDANILAVKVFPGSSDSTTWSRVICGLNFVRKFNAHIRNLYPTDPVRQKAFDIDVVNMSIAGPGSAALRTAVEGVIASGVVVVAAAGNDYGGAVQAPARYPGVISVSALNRYGTAYASFSARHADVTAPGYVFSANLAGGGDTKFFGTSRAAPQIAGAAAVILAVDVAADVQKILRESGRCPDGTERGAGPCGAWTGGGGSNEPLVDVYCAGIDADPAATDSSVCPAVT
jgi:subtilisin family serine protease